jgi:CMP-N,N'-diacetyllegionaminic acid synthase
MTNEKTNGKHRVLAVITARGGSKALPRKNVLPLGGKPLIAWTIEAARKAKRLDRVILSTDNDEIADIGRQFRCDVPFMRPAEFATDTSHHPDVMIHAAKFMEESLKEPYDIIMCLQPTVPFRKSEHIDDAIEAFFSSKAESLISLKPQEYPPWWMFSLEDSRIRPAFDYKPGVNVFNLERQEFPKVYRPNGAIYITWTASLYKHHRLVNPADCAYFLMKEADSIDIDTASDFAAAEVLLRTHAQSSNAL